MEEQETNEYVLDDVNKHCIIRNFCLVTSPSSYCVHTKCYALLHITSLYGDPLLNRKTVQNFASSTNNFLLHLLGGLKTSILAVLPNISDYEKSELEQVLNKENDVFDDMLTEHKRFTLLKNIGVYIEPVDKIIGYVAGRNTQGLQEQKSHTGIYK